METQNEIHMAIVRDGIVENVVVLTPESEWPIPEGCIGIVSAIAAIGDTYENGVFIHPTPEVEK